MTFPISLVVAVETGANSAAVIDKLGGSGILFTQLLAADAGETAVITFSDDVKVHQDFTSDPDQSDSLRCACCARKAAGARHAGRVEALRC